jgi:uncharacterized protein YndB with AHSA1/START domain
MNVRRFIIAIVGVGVVAALAFAPLHLHDRTRIMNSVIIARAPDDVFAYVTTPANWPKWHPASLAVAGATDHSLLAGEQVTEDFKVAGRTGKVVWTVQKRDAPQTWQIRGDVEGRDAGVITYTLSPVAEGTRFDREFVYDSPNLVFAALNRVSLRAQVEAESALAVANLKQRLEAAH